MKDSLIEIKKKLQRKNSRVDEAKIHINDLEHKEDISIQPEQQEGKGIKKKQGWYKEPQGHLQTYQHLNHRDARRRRRGARN